LFTGETAVNNIRTEYSEFNSWVLDVVMHVTAYKMKSGTSTNSIQEQLTHHDGVSGSHIFIFTTAIIFLKW
jgi:hypothetical protein